MKKFRAFTLVELLIALIITGLVAGSVITLFFSVFKNYEFHQDITEAKQRGQIALAVMQPFIMNAGLGLPPSAADFRSAFQWSKNGTTYRLSTLFPGVSGDPRNFAHFFQLANNGETINLTSAAPAFWVVYSVPAAAWISGGGLEALPGVRTNTAKDSDSEEFTREIQYSGSVSSQQLLAVFPPSTLKSWISFPASTPSFPFTVSELGTSKLKLRSHSSATGNMIPPLDELHYVRAAKIFVENGMLKINRLDGSGAQTVADGIAGMWCTFDSDGDRILTVRILARADARRGNQTQSGIEGWPAEAEAFWGRDARFRHAVVSRSWRIRN